MEQVATRGWWETSEPSHSGEPGRLGGLFHLSSPRWLRVATRREHQIPGTSAPSLLFVWRTLPSRKTQKAISVCKDVCSDLQGGPNWLWAGPVESCYVLKLKPSET